MARRPDRRLERIATHVVAAGEAQVPEGRLPGSLSGGWGERDPESAFSGRLARGVKPLAPRSTLPEYDPPGADRIGLSPEEISQFRELGYLIKRGLIPQDALQPFSELWWSMPPVTTAGLKRDDPSSWVNPGLRWPVDEKAQLAEQQRWGIEPNWMGGAPWPSPNDPRRDGANMRERVGRLPHKLTGGGEQASKSHNVWRWHGIGHDPDFVNATSAHPRMLYMIEALLGGPVKRPCRNRGIYSVFPNPSKPGSLGPHVDGNHNEMMCVTLVRDVEPRGGGFTMWPTSPQRLYPTSEHALHWVATPRSEEVVKEILETVEPVEFSGRAGDVFFAHAWIIHSAGLHESPNVRCAVIQDICKVRRRSSMRWTAAGKGGGSSARRVSCDMDGVFHFPTDDPEHDPATLGGREVTVQWIMDGNEFNEDRYTPTDAPDVFHHWNLGRVPVTGNVVNEPPWWEKYELPIHPMDSVGCRGGGGVPAVRLDSIAEYEGEGRWRARNRGNDWLLSAVNGVGE